MRAGTKGRILVVDDERSMREMLDIFLGREGYQVTECASGTEALRIMDQKEPFDLVISDINMPGLSGFDLLREIKDKFPDLPVLMITAYGSPDSAVEAMKLGAVDYITKPFRIEEIKARISASVERRRLAEENVELQRLLDSRFGFDNIIGKSAKLKAVFDMIGRLSDMDSTVVISGESGTGKELIARALHHNSPSGTGPFVTVNCGALVETLLESELFGHKKGSFTGAESDRMGLFATASGGTLFLDEITETSSSLQVKLLRAIQEGEIVPVGDTKPVNVDVRIVAATNRDLATEVKEGRFRDDLYYRLNVIHIHVPPLRERIEDIPLLVEHFLKTLAERQDQEVKEVASETMARLMEYSFPGNVRELENIIERGVALSPGNVINLDMLPPEVHKEVELPLSPVDLPDDGIDLDSLMEKYEKELIDTALARAGGNRTKAAGILGISFRSLRYRLKKYDSSED